MWHEREVRKRHFSATRARLVTPMTEESPNLSIKRIKNGIRLFVGFSLVGLFVIVFRSSFVETFRHLINFDYRFLILAFALISLDWVMSGLRIFIFARRVYPQITFMACVRSCFANVFLGGVTPSQTGGAAAQVYVLYREGMTALDSTVVCFLGGFLGTTVILLLCAITFSWFIKPDISAGFQLISGLSMTIFAVIFLVVLVSLIHPRMFKSTTHWLLRRIPWVKQRMDRRGAVKKLFRMVDRYHSLMTNFLVRGKLIFSFGMVLSAIIYFNKFSIAYIILRGLGLEGDYWDVMYMQVVLILIFYFAPTPGASGLAEVSTAAVMGSIVPATYQGVFVILWRFFTLILSMIIGAFIVLRYVYASGSERPHQKQVL